MHGTCWPQQAKGQNQCATPENFYDVKQLSMQIDMIFVTGLQAEIQAAYKECECVRMKLKLQEDDLLKMRTRMNDAEDAHHTRYSMNS